MEFYFYNSYKLSHKGFQFVKVNLDDNTVILRDSNNTKIFRSEVLSRFSNGGASILLEKLDDGKLMFIIKNISAIDSRKTDDERGYKLYYNLAITADEKEIKKFCSLVIYILTAFSKLKEHLLIMTEITDGDMSYNINISELKKMCADADEYVIGDMDSLIANAEKPLNFAETVFYKLIKDLYSQNIDCRFMIAVFDSNKEYFEEMNKLGSIKIKYMFNSDGSMYRTTEKAKDYASYERRTDTSENKINDDVDVDDVVKFALSVAGLIAGSALIYGIYKSFRKH